MVLDALRPVSSWESLPSNRQPPDHASSCMASTLTLRSALPPFGSGDQKPPRPASLLPLNSGFSFEPKTGWAPTAALHASPFAPPDGIKCNYFPPLLLVTVRIISKQSRRPRVHVLGDGRDASLSLGPTADRPCGRSLWVVPHRLAALF